MLSDALQKLLILQDRDLRRAQFEKHLVQIPRERIAIEAHIATHRAGIDAAKKALTELELRRKQLETTLRGFEDQIVKYKNQQMLVKKNDEYQALTHEIENTEKKISDTEGEEIQILYDLDVEREKARAAEKTLTEQIAAENAQLARIGERENQSRAELEGARAEVTAARSGVSESLLPRYDRLLKSAGLPVVVPLHEDKCGGCHLKVSNGVQTDARKGTDIVSCDNCGRIVYFVA